LKINEYFNDKQQIFLKIQILRKIEIRILKFSHNHIYNQKCIKRNLSENMHKSLLKSTKTVKSTTAWEVQEAKSR